MFRIYKELDGYKKEAGELQKLYFSAFVKFFETGSVWSPGWPQTHDPPASAS
jgi:hypothetical protein